jgi:Ca-activated chloride channel family protein
MNVKSKKWIVMLLGVMLLLLAGAVMAVETQDDVQSGVFMIRAASDQAYTPALLLKSEVDIEVSGTIAHVNVRQQFYNAKQQVMEGEYLFPLPADSAVHAMTMRIGSRVIRGEIQKKEDATRIYNQAKKEGKHAGLVEQRRQNLFATKVANILPEEIMIVEISYVEALDKSGNELSMYFPMTLTPRYTPTEAQDIQINEKVSEAIKRSEAAQAGEHRPSDQAVESAFVYADTIPAEMANPVHLSVIINDSGHVGNIESSSHKLISKVQNDKYELTTTEALVPMDRDFKLKWKVQSVGESDASFFVQKVDGQHYGLLMIMPPQPDQIVDSLPREVIFIIDTSGSMGGESIKQAKASLELAVNRLKDNQRFNIIEFNSDFQRLFPSPRAVTQENRDAAIVFVQNLQADGGTEMAPALRDALSMPADPEYLRQVVFITDGAVSNEDALFSIIVQLLGNSRLFTVGIGSAPNDLFMKKAAQIGRGTATMISSPEEVDAMMGKLFAQLESPLMRDIELSVPGNVATEIYPSRIPDLYAHEPIVVALKMNQKPDAIHIKGMGKSLWEKTVSVNNAQENPGVGTLWARAKIESLMDRKIREGSNEVLKGEITAIALSHQLVSEYTSFVAVDQVVVTQPEMAIGHEQVVNLMPAGSTMGRSYPLPRTAAGIDAWLWLGVVFAALAALMQGRRNDGIHA